MSLPHLHSPARLCLIHDVRPGVSSAFALSAQCPCTVLLFAPWPSAYVPLQINLYFFKYHSVPAPISGWSLLRLLKHIHILFTPFFLVPQYTTSVVACFVLHCNSSWKFSLLNYRLLESAIVTPLSDIIPDTWIYSALLSMHTEQYNSHISYVFQSFMCTFSLYFIILEEVKTSGIVLLLQRRKIMLKNIKYFKQRHRAQVLEGPRQTQSSDSCHNVGNPS